MLNKRNFLFIYPGQYSHRTCDTKNIYRVKAVIGQRQFLSMVFKSSFKVIIVSRKCQFTVESGEEIGCFCVREKTVSKISMKKP